MEKYLIKEIKKMSGSLVGFGIESEKIKDAINKNNNINTCFLLEDNSKGFNQNKFKIFNKTKTINIKKIKKKFKKKKIDYVIVNYTTIKPFLKTFIRDSVYINNNKLYIYGSIEDVDALTQKYQRYTNDIEIKKEKDKSIIIINNKNTKNNKLKDIAYYWKDTLNNAIDILTTILVN